MDNLCFVEVDDPTHELNAAAACCRPHCFIRGWPMAG
jgi:hypothetical protein